MNCYECAKTGAAAPAVALCLHCNAGLCLEHLREAAAEPTRGGTHMGCAHDTWEIGDTAAHQSRASHSSLGR
jgi:hypothetical protein